MIKLHILNDTQHVNILRDQEEHKHDVIANANKRLRKEIKEKIFELYELRITQPLNIIYSLRRHGYTNVPTQRQITNLISRIKKKLYGEASISYKEFVDYCQSNFKVPDDPNKAFVISYDVNASQKDNQFVRMIVSTKYLLELATKNNFACIDATYQLVYQGHPVILFGHVDKNKTFHPTCLAITTSENKQDYSFVIQSVKVK